MDDSIIKTIRRVPPPPGRKTSISSSVISNEEDNSNEKVMSTAGYNESSSEYATIDNRGSITDFAAPQTGINPPSRASSVQQRRRPPPPKGPKPNSSVGGGDIDSYSVSVNNSSVSLSVNECANISSSESSKPKPRPLPKSPQPVSSEVVSQSSIPIVKGPLSVGFPTTSSSVISAADVLSNESSSALGEPKIVTTSMRRSAPPRAGSRDQSSSIGRIPSPSPSPLHSRGPSPPQSPLLNVNVTPVDADVSSVVPSNSNTFINRSEYLSRPTSVESTSNNHVYPTSRPQSSDYDQSDQNSIRGGLGSASVASSGVRSSSPRLQIREKPPPPSSPSPRSSSPITKVVDKPENDRISSGKGLIRSSIHMQGSRFPNGELPPKPAGESPRVRSQASRSSVEDDPLMLLANQSKHDSVAESVFGSELGLLSTERTLLSSLSTDPHRQVQNPMSNAVLSEVPDEKIPRSSSVVKTTTPKPVRPLPSQPKSLQIPDDSNPSVTQNDIVLRHPTSSHLSNSPRASSPYSFVPSVTSPTARTATSRSNSRIVAPSAVTADAAPAAEAPLEIQLDIKEGNLETPVLKASATAFNRSRNVSPILKAVERIQQDSLLKSQPSMHGVSNSGYVSPDSPDLQALDGSSYSSSNSNVRDDYFVLRGSSPTSPTSPKRQKPALSANSPDLGTIVGDGGSLSVSAESSPKPVKIELDLRTSSNSTTLEPAALHAPSHGHSLSTEVRADVPVALSPLHAIALARARSDKSLTTPSSSGNPTIAKEESKNSPPHNLNPPAFEVVNEDRVTAIIAQLQQFQKEAQALQLLLRDSEVPKSPQMSQELRRLIERKLASIEANRQEALTTVIALIGKQELINRLQQYRDSLASAIASTKPIVSLTPSKLNEKSTPISIERRPRSRTPREVEIMNRSENLRRAQALVNQLRANSARSSSLGILRNGRQDQKYPVPQPYVADNGFSRSLSAQRERNSSYPSERSPKQTFFARGYSPTTSPHERNLAVLDTRTPFASDDLSKYAPVVIVPKTPSNIIGSNHPPADFVYASNVIFNSNSTRSSTPVEKVNSITGSGNNIGRAHNISLITSKDIAQEHTSPSKSLLKPRSSSPLKSALAQYQLVSKTLHQNSPTISSPVASPELERLPRSGSRQSPARAAYISPLPRISNVVNDRNMNLAHFHNQVFREYALQGSPSKGSPEGSQPRLKQGLDEESWDKVYNYTFNNPHVNPSSPYGLDSDTAASHSPPSSPSAQLAAQRSPRLGRVISPPSTANHLSKPNLNESIHHPLFDQVLGSSTSASQLKDRRAAIATSISNLDHQRARKRNITSSVGSLSSQEDVHEFIDANEAVVYSEPASPPRSGSLLNNGSGSTFEVPGYTSYFLPSEHTNLSILGRNDGRGGFRSRSSSFRNSTESSSSPYRSTGLKSGNFYGDDDNLLRTIIEDSKRNNVVPRSFSNSRAHVVSERFSSSSPVNSENGNWNINQNLASSPSSFLSARLRPSSPSPLGEMKHNPSPLAKSSRPENSNALKGQLSPEIIRLARENPDKLNQLIGNIVRRNIQLSVVTPPPPPFT